MSEYRSGGRRNGIMGPFVSTLKPEDIKAVAVYFSKQKPALQTEYRQTFRFSSAK